jgi:hypothetical protein
MPDFYKKQKKSALFVDKTPISTTTAILPMENEKIFGVLYCQKNKNAHGALSASIIIEGAKKNT